MALFSKLFSKFRSGSMSAADWEEIERSLIESDLGATAAREIVASAKKMKAEEVEAAVLEVLRSWLSQKPRTLIHQSGALTTILVVGVNGTGKTTSVAKLSHLLKAGGAAVIVAAADTFRAAATEQLQTWGARLDIPVVAGKNESDPAAVAFEAVVTALGRSCDYLIIDTAGRLHTKSGLMDELGKVRRVVEKKTLVDEVLLVIDGTTGQNGIAQARIFLESVAVTGLIVTKLDGSARGGIALAIERETGLPIKFIGTGEGASDLTPFNSETYLRALISE
ncbi:MAG: signal recognition particle-docking protein FtsY [Actinomycetes bacterium]